MTSICYSKTQTNKHTHKKKLFIYFYSASMFFVPSFIPPSQTIYLFKGHHPISIHNIRTIRTELTWLYPHIHVPTTTSTEPPPSPSPAPPLTPCPHHEYLTHPVQCQPTPFDTPCTTPPTRMLSPCQEVGEPVSVTSPPRQVPPLVPPACHVYDNYLLAWDTIADSAR